MAESVFGYHLHMSSVVLRAMRPGYMSARYAGSARRWTYAGVVADALAYYGLKCEFAFVEHRDDGGQDVVSRVVFVEWRLGATGVAYVIG